MNYKSQRDNLANILKSSHHLKYIKKDENMGTKLNPWKNKRV